MKTELIECMVCRNNLGISPGRHIDFPVYVTCLASPAKDKKEQPMANDYQAPCPLFGFMFTTEEETDEFGSD